LETDSTDGRGFDVIKNKAEALFMASTAVNFSPRTAPNHDAPYEVAMTTQTKIAQRAHEIWQERGCPEGSACQDWFQAENELKQQRG
jgi:hypothetical protein